MNEFVIPFLYKLAWATVVLSSASLTLNFLAKSLKAKSYRLMAISGFAPLVIGATALFVSWQIAIPPNAAISNLSALTKMIELDTDSNQPHKQPLDAGELVITPSCPVEKTADVESILATEIRQGSAVPSKIVVVALLGLIWLAGLTWKIGTAFVSYLRLCMLSRSEFTVVDNRSQAEWLSLLEQDRCPRIPIYESSILGPALCLIPSGYALVVPRSCWTQASKKDRELVMRHELSHYHRNHILLIALCRAFAAIHWFNPFAKACVARFEVACEWQADDDAIDSNEESAVQLAKSLVYFNSPRLSILGYSGAAEFARNECQLKKRVARLLSSHFEKEAGMYKVSLMTIAIAFMLALATGRFTADAAEMFPMDNSNSSANTENTILTTDLSMTEPEQNVAAKKTERDKENPYRILFDAIASRPNSPGFSLALLQQAFRKDFKQHPNQLEVQLKSLKSIARTENGEWVTYEFDVDPLLFFHEIAFFATADKTVADEVLNGCLRDINGPKIDMRKILNEEFRPRVKLVCRFIDESRFERLVEIGLVDQAAFLPKLRQFLQNEVLAIPQTPDYSHVIFQQAKDEIPPEFETREPKADEVEPWAVAVHNQRIYWGTVDLVEKAIKR